MYTACNYIDVDSVGWLGEGVGTCNVFLSSLYANKQSKKGKEEKTLLGTTIRLVGNPYTSC
jgi:hypothetical protein